MKKVIIVIAFSFLLISSYSQSCLPKGITFTTQSQIDSFQINYPYCSEIEGFVKIIASDITNLDGLINITQISGDFSIGGVFVSPEGWYSCLFNQYLTNIQGLQNLISIGGDLHIMGNSSLLDLAGMENLITIDGALSIGFFGPWGFSCGNALEDITALSNLESINGTLQISANALSSLEGLNNIDPGTISNLHIFLNPNLSHCEIQSICQYLDQNEGAFIGYNAQGCDSKEEILDSCEANAVMIDQQYIKDYLILYPNPAYQELNISVEGLTIDELIIYTLTGQQVFAIRPESETIDISYLKPGMYIVEVNFESRKIRQKLLVQR
jgi:hypothetical protein